MKGDDLSCVPLCRLHHSECHAFGRHTFWIRHNLDIDETIRSTLHKYIVMLEEKCSKRR
jgi:hypothetical protein